MPTISLHEASTKIQNGFMSAPIAEKGKIAVRCDIDGKDFAILSIRDTNVNCVEELGRDGAVVKGVGERNSENYIIKRTMNVTDEFEINLPVKLKETTEHLTMGLTATVKYLVEVRRPIQEYGPLTMLCDLEKSGDNSIRAFLNTAIEDKVIDAIFEIHNGREIFDAINLNNVKSEEKKKRLTELVKVLASKYGVSVRIQDLQLSWTRKYLDELENCRKKAEEKGYLDAMKEIIQSIN